MDLTNPKNTANNPDALSSTRSERPAESEDAGVRGSADEGTVWAIVAYVQTLRQK
jgi:hypothetical protein